MGSQQFCLRWNNHQSNMLNVFDQLLQNEALVDVTLACDGLSLKAHKVVLSACSPYFQSLFLENPCQHPIVFLKDVRYTDLKALVDFMYKGEVNVSQEQLNALLQTAESLKVKGLAEVTPESAPHPRGDVSSNYAAKVVRNASGVAMALSELPNKDSSIQMAPSSPPLSPRSFAPSNFEQFKRSHSPPAKRRKAKPRKRIPENSLPSDHEDSDALDLSTASPEMLEQCMDAHDNNYESKVPMGICSSVTPPSGDRGNGGGADHTGNSTGQLSSSLHLDVDDNYQSHDGAYGNNQNQALASPSGIGSSHRLSMIPKVPALMSVMSTAPLPSTSATQASIQDIRRLCQYSRQSQQHKPTWTEEDMVQALEAVQSGRLTYALAARKFDIPKATLHYYVILMKAVEAVRSGRMTAEIAAIKYNVRTSILLDCLFGRQGSVTTSSSGNDKGVGGGGGGGSVKREL